MVRTLFSTAFRLDPAFGETPEEALREVQLAKAAWLQTCRARKKTVPPRYPPAIYAAVSA